MITPVQLLINTRLEAFALPAAAFSSLRVFPASVAGVAGVPAASQLAAECAGTADAGLAEAVRSG